jgi:hypothetical protein
MSVVPVICEKQRSLNVQGDGQRPDGERNFGISQLLGQTFGWKWITDKKVIEGRESKRAF